MVYFFSCLSTQHNVVCSVKVTVDLHLEGDAFEPQLDSFFFSSVTLIIIYCISTVNTQHIQRPDVLVQLGYIWRIVSAVNLPSSGQQRIVFLRYSQIVCPMGSHCLH